jgi:hypothetical protein
MWRKVRVFVLLLILLFVALTQYLDRARTTDWDLPLRVAIIPIRADDADATASFVTALAARDFESLEQFFREEAQRYSLVIDQPIRFTLAPALDERSPALEPDAGPFGSLLWSLRARYWAWRNGDVPGVEPNVRLFVQYHDPARSPSLAHSVGLQKGLFGIVNVFADAGMSGSNDVVIAHELLHTLGATDKYSFVNNQPVYPVGYAEPELEPLYPQRFAELMGGRIPLDPQESDMPESLQQVLLGPGTALEIGWTRQ